MISKTSLFNKGIYKSTIKRNIWGSVLYFIILFFMTSMPLISYIDNQDSYIFKQGRPAVYRGSFVQPSLILAVFISAIVALLVYRFVHSRKTAVFVHSLPVGRKANYISTLAAAFTLMVVPVVANGIVLMGLSVGAFHGNFGIVHCLVWIGINILCQVIMFSVATFASMITGNTFAAVVFNIIVHVFPMIIVSCGSVIADNFLYGYYSDAGLINSVIEANPAVWIIALGTQLGYIGTDSVFALPAMLKDIPVYILASAVLYFISWKLYKNRGMESAEDVAAFGILNPVFKYFVSAVGILAAYGIFNSFFYESPAVFFSVLVVCAVVIYFACEMMLKKTLRVWKNSYKGFFAFLSACIVVLCVFAFTSFFGYETRIPDMNDIEQVALYNYYYSENEPFVSSEDIVKNITDVHSALVSKENIPLADSITGGTRLHFVYKLKNGKTISRVYKVSEAVNYDVMNKLYGYDEYITANEGIFKNYKLSKVKFDSEKEITDNQKNAELLECVKKDMLSLEYGKTKIDYEHWGISLKFAFEIPRGEKNVFGEIHTYEPMDESEYNIVYESVKINANYTNTLNWLMDNGYDSLFEINMSENVYIVPTFSGEEMNDTEKPFAEHLLNKTDRIVITDEAHKKLLKDMICNTEILNSNACEYKYAVVCENSENSAWIITMMDEKNINGFLTEAGLD